MSTKTLAFEDPQTEEFDSYKTISKYAVFSLVLSLLAALGLLHPALAVFGLVAIVLGAVALFTISAYPHELIGAPVAWAGAVIGTLFFVSSVGYHTVIYFTEVPDGYERISWGELQPERGSNAAYSVRAQQLNGKSVFIKGYVHPGVDGQGEVKEFVLVRDMGVCCFGGQPKLTDMIEVSINNDERVRYSYRRIALAGTLKVSRPVGKKAVGDLQGGYFQFEADVVQ